MGFDNNGKPLGNRAVRRANGQVRPHTRLRPLPLHPLALGAWRPVDNQAFGTSAHGFAERADDNTDTVYGL